MKAKRIFIGPQEIAGYYANLAKGFREIGVDCDYITYAPHPFGYSGETHIPILLRLSRFFNRFQGKPNSPYILKALIAVPGEVFQSLWAISAIFKYDVFIFSFGRSLLRAHIDLLILKLFNKKAFVVYHGSDARPPFVNGFIHNPDKKTTHLNLSKLKRRAAKISRSLHSFEVAGATVVGNPFSTYQYANHKFANFLTFGLPISLKHQSKSKEINETERKNLPVVTRILHSPSNPAGKGSAIIQSAIKQLQEKGFQIEFVKLEGELNSEVINEIEKCDFVIDQVFSDFPLAGFATEAAWFRKPAVVGGYGFEKLRTLVPEAMWPPSKTCHPDDIEQAIEELIINVEERLRLGAMAQRFVREKWNAAEVARRYLHLIDGDIPDEWWLDPKSVVYFEGAGQSIERSKENIRQLVDKFGPRSLRLSHRPELERAFLNFAGVEETH